MGWLSVLGGLVKLVNVVLGIVERKKLMDAGSAKAIASTNQVVLKHVEEAMAARRGVKHDADSVRADPDRRD